MRTRVVVTSMAGSSFSIVSVDDPGWVDSRPPPPPPPPPPPTPLLPTELLLLTIALLVLLLTTPHNARENAFRWVEDRDKGVWVLHHRT